MTHALACPRPAGADTDVVRRLAVIIVLCCALGGGVTAVASAQTPPPSLGPPSDIQPAGAPPASAPMPAAEPAGAAEAGPASAAPDAEPAQPSVTATPTGLRLTPERFGGIPASNSTPVAPSRPQLRVGRAIGVTTTRVGRDDSSDDNADDRSEGSTLSANCDVRNEVQILHDKPTGKTREVATLNVEGAPAQHEDILSLLKRKACEAGANAVLIKSMSQTRVEGVKVDHVEAVGLIVGTPKPPVDPHPCPRASRSRLKVPPCPKPSRLIRARRPS